MVTQPFPFYILYFPHTSITQTLGLWKFYIVFYTPWQLYNACKNQRALPMEGIYRNLKDLNFEHFTTLGRIVKP